VIVDHHIFPMALENRRLLGTALVLLSAVAWSLNGLYVRFLSVDVWTTLTGRGIATSSVLFAALLVTRRGGTVRLLMENVRRGWIVIIAGSLCMMAFVAALFYTTVANVTVIYAASPLMAAVLARFLIGERLVARTIVAFAVALAGIVLMVGASLGTGRLVGDFLALMMSATFAIVIVEMRRKPDIDNVASSFLTCLLTALVLAPFASFGTIDLQNAIVLFLFGFTSNVLGFFLFIAAVRRMPPAEAGLIATVEIVLAPFWVWLFFSEDPGTATLIGGAIVTAAVIFQISGELRQGRRMVIANGLATEVENLR
jgi:drug/metabolite transporter (DMT)-like permease